MQVRAGAVFSIALACFDFSNELFSHCAILS